MSRLSHVLWESIQDPHRAWKRASNPIRALIGHGDYAKFIVLSTARTGSNLLLSLLESHPQIYVRGEILAKLEGRDPVRVLSGIWRRQPRSVRAAGFKIFYYHPIDDKSNRIWEMLAQMEDLHVVHLKRRNKLRTLVSEKLAHKTHNWKGTNVGAQIEGNGKSVTISIDLLTKEIEQIEKWELNGDNIFAASHMITVWYEDLVRDPETEIRKITDFLHVQPHVPKTFLKKQNPEPLRTLLTNYDELQSAMLGTKWSVFFQDREQSTE